MSDSTQQMDKPRTISIDTQEEDKGNQVVIDDASEADLLEVLKFQEKKLGTSDPQVIETRRRLAALAKLRYDNMSLEQQMQSSADKIKRKHKAIDEAMQQVTRLQGVANAA